MSQKATPLTVSSALRREEEMMRLAVRQAPGHPVPAAPPDPVAHMALTDLVPAAPGPGRVTIRELLHRVVPATPIVAGRLGADSDRVLLVEQVVSLGDEPLFHAVGYSPADTAEHVSAVIRAIDRHPRELDMAELFEVLFGVPLGRVAVGVGALRADLRTARLLKIEAGTAILVREFLQFDAAGRPRSYNFTQFRPDRVRFTARHASGAINTLRASRGQVTRPADHGSCRAIDVAPRALGRPPASALNPGPGALSRVQPGHARHESGLPMAVTAPDPAEQAERTAHLDVAGLNVSYDTPDGVIEAVKDVSFTVDRGECVALVGESGSGKSNVCLAIGGFLTAANARMWYDRMTLGGAALDRSVRRSLIPRFTPGIAMIFQDAMTSLDPVWTVRSQLRAVLRAADKIPRRDRDDAARDWLAKVGLTDTRRVLGSRPYELSGGMRQRVMLALALAGNPSLVIADEPTSALDASLSRDVMELMLGLTATSGIALLLVTHDIKLCEEYSDRTLVMYRGSVVEELGSAALTTAAEHPYTQGLVSCVPTLEDADRDVLPTIGEWLELATADAGAGAGDA